MNMNQLQPRMPFWHALSCCYLSIPVFICRQHKITALYGRTRQTLQHKPVLLPQQNPVKHTLCCRLSCYSRQRHSRLGCLSVQDGGYKLVLTPNFGKCSVFMFKRLINSAPLVVAERDFWLRNKEVSTLVNVIIGLYFFQFFSAKSADFNIFRDY